MKQKVFSGIQPTGSGELHIGNLVGALSNWVSMQEEWEAIYCVVDLHAMTVPFEVERFRKARIVTAKTILASGVDPDKALIYYQSQVPQHAELAWILGTFTGMGQLERMTQYKEKSDKVGQNLGVFSYPVLMAADILLHKVHAVPVGDDQTQHLELTRDLVERFNSRFGEEFPFPERITPEIGARVMSLQDPTSKMSKSDDNGGAFVLLTDDPDTITKKIKSSVTDSGSDVTYDWGTKPGISNLLELLSFFTGTAIPALEDQYRDGGYGGFKAAVAEAVIDGLTPIRTAFKRLDDEEVSRIMQKGALNARQKAEAHMSSVRRKVGLSG